MRVLAKFFIGAIALALILFGSIAFADITLPINPNLPGPSSDTGIPGIVTNFYSFALMMSGILAFGAIVWGGIKYATGRGNPSAESEGKSWITNALLGLLLLAGAYIILTTINPELVGFNIAGIPYIAPELGGGNLPPNSTSTNSGACPLPALSAINDPVARQMEGGATVLWSTGGRNSGVDQNLAKLSAEFTRLRNLVAGRGGTATPNSVYRPLGYQMHLYEIYRSSQALTANPGYSNNPSCAQIITTLISEQQKHGICYGNHPCLVAAPNGNAPHVRGVGIDIGLSGPVSYGQINALLQARGIDLRWQGLSGDTVHFELQNPPYSGPGT